MPARPNRSNSLLRAAVALALSQGAWIAPAQAQATAGEVASSDQIVVTARRREELLQDVPASVSAFSGAQLEKKGLPDITGLSDIIPNTTLKTSRATNSTLTAFIRGIGQQDPVAGYEQGVGIYLDDVYLARPQGALTDIYDLERIEVLRGPQGTLYGRNTIGGAIKYVTRKLSATPEMNVKLTAGNYGEKDVVAKGNLPITDILRIGATLAAFNHEGYGTNIVNGKDNYNKKVGAGRVSVELTPISPLFIRFAADRTVDDSLPRAGYRLLPGLPPGSEPVLSGNYDTRANLYTVLGHRQQVITRGESLLVEYAINQDLSFKSISASRKSKSWAPIDFDSLNSVTLEAPAIYHDDQKSQEFQFTYTGAKWQGVAGYYYMKSNAFNEFDVLLNALGGLSVYTMDDIDTKTWAAFADVSYNVTNALSVNLGGRYTNDNRQARIFAATYLGLAGSPTLGNPAAVRFGPANTDLGKSDLDRTDTKFTPKVAVAWKFAHEHNVYASYSEGFKGGFFDPRMNLAGNPTSALSLEKRKGVKPEEVKTVELGLKSALDKGRIQTNAAVFYSDYTNVQIPGSVPTFDAAGNVNGFAGNVTNAGKAKIKGVELEALAHLTDAFTVSGMVSFIDAKYKEWIVANGLTGSAAALINIAGAAEFQNTPKQSANVTATYEWPLAMGRRSGALALSNSVSYKSKVYQNEFARQTGNATLDVNLPGVLLLAQEAYTLWDASLVWTSRDRKLQVALIGRNLTDKRYKVAGYPFHSIYPNTVTAFYGDPRTVKATVSVTF
jgi:iron complex outermembrane receptor protein